MTDKEPPECGFIEHEDGSVEWGATWDREVSCYDEPVCVIYGLWKCGAWIPFSAWTREEEDDRYYAMHDCDWIESEATLYHHESGGGAGICVGEFVDPSTVPARIWIADGVDVRGHSVRVGDDRVPGDVLTDEALLAMGYRRVHGPVPDPFADGIEGDTFYDERTGQRLPDEDGCMCGCCNEMFVEHEDDIAVVNEYEATEKEIAGLYRTLSRRSTLWVCPLPHNMDDGQREVLIDAVRARVDEWISEYPDKRSAKVHEWFAPELALRLDISRDAARRLCEDAGYGGDHG